MAIRKIKYLNLPENIKIPFNFHFIEKHVYKLKDIKRNDLTFSEYCDEYNGYTVVNSFYKASSIIFSNED